MTIQEMHQRIEQELFHIDGLDPERIDQVLNDEILNFVRTKLPKKRNLTGEGLDDDMLNAMDLSELKRTVALGNIISEARTATFPLPEQPKCLYPIKFFAEVHYSLTRKPANTSHPVTYSPGRILDSEYEHEIAADPLLKSSYKSPAGVIEGDKLIVAVDKSFILKGVRLTYIKYPQKVSLSSSKDCDLSEHVHPLIVNRTVAALLEQSESQRMQTKVAMNNIVE